MIASFLSLGQATTVVPSELGRMIVNGISLGAIYAVLAMGFVIIFKATQVFNLANGAIAALGAFFVAAFATTLNFPGRLMESAPAWLQWGLSVTFALVAIARDFVTNILYDMFTQHRPFFLEVEDYRQYRQQRSASSPQEPIEPSGNN